MEVNIILFMGLRHWKQIHLQHVFSETVARLLWITAAINDYFYYQLIYYLFINQFVFKI